MATEARMPAGDGPEPSAGNVRSDNTQGQIASSGRAVNLIKRALPPAVVYSCEKIRHVNFAEMADGTLIELLEDPLDATQTRLAVCTNGRCVVGLGARDEGLELLPVPRHEGLLAHIRLPRGVRPYGSVSKLLGDVEALIKRCVILPDDRLVSLVARFVLSTWVADRLPVAPYLCIVGLPESGKTTLAQVLVLVCHRALLTADITPCVLLEACTNLNCTLLIDDADSQVKALSRLLRMGTTPGLISMGKNPGLHSFGPKVLCFLELPDDPAFNTRCVVIPIKEANAANLARPDDPTILALADNLRRQLLQYRFDHFYRVRLDSVPIDRALRPRAHDLFRCLAAVAGAGEDWDSLSRAVFHQDVALRDPLTPPQAAVVAACFSQVHLAARNFRSLLVSYLTKLVNDELERNEERLRLTPRKVGAVLTTLGFLKRERTSRGWVAWFEQDDVERLHELMQVHGEDLILSPEVHRAISCCPQCMQRGIVNAAGVEWR